MTEKRPSQAFAYLNKLREGLAVNMRGKLIIYLDTRYWILLRDFVLGKSNNSDIGRIHEMLFRGASAGILICPIGEDVFYEITRQTVAESLGTTISLIDQLSRGVCSLPHRERVRAEAYSFISSLHRSEKSAPVVWTKLPYILGSIVPVNTGFGERDLEMQNAFADFMWHTTLSEFAKIVGLAALQGMPRHPDFEKLLNEDYEERKNQFTSFTQVFRSEVYWEIERFLPEFEQAVADLYFDTTNVEPVRTVKDVEESLRMLRNLLNVAFSAGKLRLELPTIYVGAALSAAIWWDKNRRFKQNDILDIGHAQVALPYCNAFLTEANMKSFANSKHLGFTDRFPCKVLSSFQEVREYLEGMLQEVGSN